VKEHIILDLEVLARQYKRQIIGTNIASQQVNIVTSNIINCSFQTPL